MIAARDIIVNGKAEGIRGQFWRLKAKVRQPPLGT